MRNITRKFAALFMVAAMMAITAMTALAGTNTVEMFGVTKDGYVFSGHSGMMIDSVTVDKDGEYTVIFKEISMGPVTGYISAIETADGIHGEIDGTTMTLTFTPENTAFTGLYRQADRSLTPVDKVGTLITYDVTLSSGRHSTSQGAIVIE